MAVTRLQCPACSGVYDDVDRQGVRYFHVCPPLSVPELAAAIAADVVVLSKADAKRLDAATAADALDPVAPGDPSRVDQVLASISVQRPGHRDENEAETPAPVSVPVDPDDVVTGVRTR